MRYMIIVRATPLSEAGIIPDDPPLMAAMASYHEDLAKAGFSMVGEGMKTLWEPGDQELTHARAFGETFVSLVR